jgi:hypothetical protein
MPQAGRRPGLRLAVPLSNALVFVLGNPHRPATRAAARTCGGGGGDERACGAQVLDDMKARYADLPMRWVRPKPCWDALSLGYCLIVPLGKPLGTPYSWYPGSTHSTMPQWRAKAQAGPMRRSRCCCNLWQVCDDMTRSQFADEQFEYVIDKV